MKAIDSRMQGSNTAMIGTKILMQQLINYVLSKTNKKFEEVEKSSTQPMLSVTIIAA